MSELENLSDIELIALYKDSNNLETVGELFKRYKHIVYGISLKYLNNKVSAEDTLMEVFEELIKSLHKADIRKFKPWIGTVTRNHLHKKFRTKNKLKTASLEDLHINYGDKIMELSEEDTLISEKAEIELKESSLLKAINELKEEQAVCVKLFFLENKSYTEVCEITGHSFKKVKSFIQNGKRNLKIKLEG